MFFESFLLNIVVALVLIVALTFDYVTKFFSYWYVRHVPNKTPVPFFGTDYHRVLGLRNTTEEVNTLYYQYPKDKLVGSVKSRLPDVILKDPELIKQVLVTSFENFQSRGLDLDKSRDVCIRNNLFYADGAKWTLLRQGLELVLNDMTCVEDGLQACLAGTNGDANVQELFAKVLDVVFKDLLLGDIDGSITELRSAVQKRTFIDKLKSYIKNIFPSLYVLFSLQTIPEEHLEKTLKIVKESKLIHKAESIMQFDIKDKNRNLKNKPEDLALGILSTFITEGYIPCLNFLTSLFYELANNTEIQRKSRNSDEYLECVIKETLRLHPHYSVITRKCVERYKFPELNDNKVLIDRGVTLNIPVEAIHKDNTYYKDAGAFRPERFLNEVPKEFTFFPFGVGPRKCVGEKLSLQIIRSVTKVVLNNYEIEPTEKTPSTLPVVDHNFGRIIDKDIWLRFKPVH